MAEFKFIAQNNWHFLVNPKYHIDKLANILAINAQRITHVGLINGHLGVAMFFYYYSRYRKLNQYTIMADGILDLVINKAMRTMDRSFSNGLFGLGWCLQYLSDHGFIDLDSEALEDYNMLASQQYTLLDLENDCSCHIPLFSKGLYCIRINDNRLAHSAISALKFVMEHPSHTLDADFLLSIKYVLNKCRLKFVTTEQYRNDICYIDTALHDVFKDSNLDCVNKHLLNCLKGDGSNTDIDSVLELYLSWQSVVYDDVIKIKDRLPNGIIDDYIDCINVSNPEQLTLEGLSSLGINLIKMDSYAS